tara:strand:+ start:139 stop:780 length:642 start_codon:yes stop_codon:yes gene_type:complete
MAGETKFLQEIAEKIENPTDAVKDTVDVLVRDVNKLDRNEKIPPETMEKIKKVSEDANKILKDVSEFERQRRTWQDRYDLAQKLIKGYKKIADANQIASSLNPVAMAISIAQVALIVIQDKAGASAKDILGALKRAPGKAKRVLKRSIQNLKDLLDAKKRQERERRKNLKEQGYTDEEIAEYEEDIDELFEDVEIEDDEDFLAELEEDDFSDY